MPERPLSAMPSYAARPTVRVRGRAVTEVTELLRSLAVVEREGGLSSLEMVLDNTRSDDAGGAGLAFEDERVFGFGAPVTVGMGDERAPREVFRGRVTGIEGRFEEAGASLAVLAEDALQRARMTRRTRVHQDLSVEELAGEVARALGLAPVVTGFSASLGLQVQFNESDLAFIRRVLWTRDGDLQVVGGELHIHPRNDLRRTAIELRWLGQLRAARVFADLAHQVTRLTVGGWNARDGRRVAGGAVDGDLGAPPADGDEVVRPGPGAGRAGARLLRDSLGDREEHLSDLPAVTDEEAGALAAAAYARRARRFVCLEGTAEGNPLLRVGSHVQVTGLSPRFDNTYYVVRTCHRYDAARGYETDFEAECARLGAP